MAGKWADYLISEVGYNAAETHIEEALVHSDTGDSVAPGTVQRRSTVVEWLEAGYTFETIFKNTDGSWREGAKVEIIKVGDEKFIRTDRDAIAEDNLENLPRL